MTTCPMDVEKPEVKEPTLKEVERQTQERTLRWVLAWLDEVLRSDLNPDQAWGMWLALQELSQATPPRPRSEEPRNCDEKKENARRTPQPRRSSSRRLRSPSPRGPPALHEAMEKLSITDKKTNLRPRKRRRVEVESENESGSPRDPVFEHLPPPPASDQEEEEDVISITMRKELKTPRQGSPEPPTLELEEAISKW